MQADSSSVNSYEDLLFIAIYGFIFIQMTTV